MNVVLVSILTAIQIVMPQPARGSDTPPVFGLVEEVRLYPGEILVLAKLDTGADNSSLHAVAITRFKRKGERWVRFQTLDEDGEPVTLERRLVRTAKIKKPGGTTQSRPVVSMGVCLGTIYREVEVTLADRSRFRCPMVLGRSFMANTLMVDPSLRSTTKSECPHAPKQ
ncbi:MAG: RimK/LysX family protein [Thermodesulfobacteriota bacterium]